MLFLELRSNLFEAAFDGVGQCLVVVPFSLRDYVNTYDGVLSLSGALCANLDFALLERSFVSVVFVFNLENVLLLTGHKLILLKYFGLVAQL